MFDKEQLLKKFDELNGRIERVGDSIDDSDVSSLRDEVDGLLYSIRGIEDTITTWSVNVLELRNEVDDLRGEIEAIELAEQTAFVPTYGNQELKDLLHAWSLMAERLSHANFHETMLKNPALFWHASAIFMVTNAPSKTFRLAEYVKDNYDNTVNH